MPLAAVPEGVRHVIARRRRRLAGITNRLLDVASTVERPFLFEPVRNAAGLSDADGLAALDEALQAALVVPDPVPDRYDFTHALIRHTVYQELNPSRRLRLHRDVAAALAAARAAGRPDQRGGGRDPIPPRSIAARGRRRCRPGAGGG